MDENAENVVAEAQEKAEAPRTKRKYTRRQPAEKIAAEKSEKKPVEEQITLQYDFEEWSLAELKERVIETYVEGGHRRGNIKKIALYIKPEERKVYYVINEKESGDIDFD